MTKRIDKGGNWWEPVCGYCNEPITFKFEHYGHVCVNEKCDMKNVPLIDYGYRAGDGRGWCYTAYEKTYLFNKVRDENAKVK